MTDPHPSSRRTSPAEHLQIDCFDANNSEVRLIPLPAPPHKSRPLSRP